MLANPVLRANNKSIAEVSLRSVMGDAAAENGKLASMSGQVEGDRKSVTLRKKAIRVLTSRILIGVTTEAMYAPHMGAGVS
jgi:hypothetical protein